MLVEAWTYWTARQRRWLTINTGLLPSSQPGAASKCSASSGQMSKYHYVGTTDYGCADFSVCCSLIVNSWNNCTSTHCSIGKDILGTLTKATSTKRTSSICKPQWTATWLANCDQVQETKRSCKSKWNNTAVCLSICSNGESNEMAEYSNGMEQNTRFGCARYIKLCGTKRMEYSDRAVSNHPTCIANSTWLCPLYP